MSLVLWSIGMIRRYKELYNCLCLTRWTKFNCTLCLPCQPTLFLHLISINALKTVLLTYNTLIVRSPVLRHDLITQDLLMVIPSLEKYINAFSRKKIKKSKFNSTELIEKRNVFISSVHWLSQTEHKYFQFLFFVY